MEKDLPGPALSTEKPGKLGSAHRESVGNRSLTTDPGEGD